MKSGKAKKFKPVKEKMANDGFYNDRKERHFRYRVKTKKKINHQNYIIGEKGDDFYSLGITHARYKDHQRRHTNHELHPNPDPQDRSPSFIRKQIERSNKHGFERHIEKGLRISSEDDDYVDVLIEKRRKHPDSSTKK